MKFVIGEKIKEKVEQNGVTQKAFASAIGMTTRNLERFFERSDISINQLVKASEFLNFDFVSLFLENTVSGKNSPILRSEPTQTIKSISATTDVSIQINIAGDISLIYKHFPDLLNKVKKEAEERGLHLV